jgi:alpha-tubulin suppressor-like RCC1 family protein
LGAYQQLETCDGIPCSGGPYPVSFLPDVRFIQVSAGTLHTCALAESGDAWCWGMATDGQLGAGTVSTIACGDGGERCATRPVRVSQVKFKAVAAGYRHTCGISLDGVAYCWGSNALGQGGRGTGPGSDVPVAVAPTTDP